MEAGGVAAIEVVARDLKALGLYQARALAYDGVEVDILEQPASISRSFIQHESGFRPPGAALGFTPHASLMQACQATPCPTLSRTLGLNWGPAIVGASAMRSPCADRHRPGDG